MSKKARAVFLDRDGVLNEVVFRGKVVASPRTIEEFRLVAGIETPLQTLKSAGFRLFVVSNQPDVARNLMSAAELEKMTQRILTTCPVDRVLLCPHDDSDGCPCRKPKPGMLLQLASEEGLDLESSFMVGDSAKDVQAGRSAGCRTILLRRAYNEDVDADFVVESLSDTLSIVQRGESWKR